LEARRERRGSPTTSAKSAETSVDDIKGAGTGKGSKKSERNQGGQKLYEMVITQ